MQCHLNGVQISEVHTFLVESPSMTTHVLELTKAFNAAHPLIILLQLSNGASYFDVHSMSKAEYENEDIPKIHFTAEEPPWDPSTNEYSDREACMLNHQGQSSILDTAARGPVYVSTVISYSLTYNADDVMDSDNLVTTM